MARIKVKQISDFVTGVESVIALETADETASINSLESIDSIANLSIDSLEVVDSAAKVANDASIASLDAYDSVQDLSIDSLEVVDSAAKVANDASINSLEAIDSIAVLSINSIEVVDSKQTADIATNAAAIDTLADANDSINSLESVDSVQNLSIDSLEVVDSAAKVANDASIDSLDAYDSVQDLSIDSLEDVDSVQNLSIDALEAQTTYVRQGAQVTATDRADFLTPILLTATDDLAVFVNGLEIYPVGTLSSSGGEIGGAPVSLSSGYQITGTTITFVGIGYDLEGDDVVHVHGITA